MHWQLTTLEERLDICHSFARAAKSRDVLTIGDDLALLPLMRDAAQALCSRDEVLVSQAVSEFVALQSK